MKKGQKNKRINLFDKSYLEMRDQLQTSTKKELKKEIEHFQDSRDWKDDIEKDANTPVLACLEHDDHKVPYTRREFIDAGLFGSAVLTLTPALFPSAANALVCPTGGAGGNGRLPLLVIDASAGATFVGPNIVVGRSQPDQFLAAADYSQFGLPAAVTPDKFSTAQMQLFGAGSKMLWHPNSVMATTIRNISQQTGGTFLNNTDGITIACASDDDTSDQLLSFSQAVVAAGNLGTLAGAIGTRTSGSGGRAASLLADAARNSTQVRNAVQANSLVNPGDLGTGLAGAINQQPPRLSYVLEQISKLTQMQSNQQRNLAASAQTVLGCGAQSNISNLGALDFSNLYTRAQVNTAFGTTNLTNATDQAIAAGAYLALNGEVSVATIEVGGCDYHANSAAQQIAKDTEMGTIIGRTLRMAQAFNKPIAIYMITDGSASTANGSKNDGTFNRSTTEAGAYSSTHLIVYNPAGRPVVSNAQFGQYGAAGVVPGATAWAGLPSAAAQLAAVNYFYLAGQIQKVSLLGGLPGGRAAVDLLGFGAPIISES